MAASRDQDVAEDALDAADGELPTGPPFSYFLVSISETVSLCNKIENRAKGEKSRG